MTGPVVLWFAAGVFAVLATVHTVVFVRLDTARTNGRFTVSALNLIEAEIDATCRRLFRSLVGASVCGMTAAIWWLIEAMS